MTNSARTPGAVDADLRRIREIDFDDFSKRYLELYEFAHSASGSSGSKVRIRGADPTGDVAVDSKKMALRERCIQISLEVATAARLLAGATGTLLRSQTEAAEVVGQSKTWDADSLRRAEDRARRRTHPR